MTTQQVAEALEAWATDTVDGLSSYGHQPEELAKALPLVICEVKRNRVTKTDADLPGGAYQQVNVRTWNASLMLLVSPDPTWTASTQLYAMVDALGAALRADSTLGGRVAMAAPVYDATYDPPEVEHSDGTVARMATFLFTVGERVEA